MPPKKNCPLSTTATASLLWYLKKLLHTMLVPVLSLSFMMATIFWQSCMFGANRLSQILPLRVRAGAIGSGRCG